MPFLAGRRCPVLTIRRSALNVEWDRALPDPPPSEVVSLESSHFPHQERPEERNEIVLEWLRRLPATRARTIQA
jgi:pimeloyl-ACP methyl ester carboxylesterase